MGCVDCKDLWEEGWNVLNVMVCGRRNRMH